MIGLIIILLILLNKWDCHLSGAEDGDPGEGLQTEKAVPTI